MLDPDKVREYFGSELVHRQFNTGDYAEAPAALPDASLDFLVESCRFLSIQRIFEFGSGRSTKALLAANFYVTSLEDNDYWMNETLKTLVDTEKKRHTSFVESLKTRFLGLFPVLDWVVTGEVLKKLCEADLIIVDSPYYTPFRESTLWTSLKNSKGALIILDDTRIPTLQRICDRIGQSRDLLHTRVHVGHGFDLFFNTDRGSLQLNHSVIDTLKGWRRYFQGRRFYNKLKSS